MRLTRGTTDRLHHNRIARSGAIPSAAPLVVLWLLNRLLSIAHGRVPRRPWTCVLGRWRRRVANELMMRCVGKRSEECAAARSGPLVSWSSSSAPGLLRLE